ncbi:tetratricopeptide repeat protein [Winogradskyella sp. PG-2]|uniref:tetratricopeptide repeat protein n=1 Tax=Winogradskyella sp. PG-2 TaxID=754409 RepID=UPI000458704C|nr:tetratricopeptide repeat protein [Winogradskyella sp. PG-2]BAO77701.1 hypothetical protein WPG_3471 [Winogradskyella sp. PG-2]
MKDNYSKGMVLVKDSSYKEALPYLNTAYTIARDSINSKKKLRQALLEYYSANIALKKFALIDSLELTDMLLKSSDGLNKAKLLDYSSRLEQFADSLSKYRQYKDAIKLYEERKSVLSKNDLSNTGDYAKTLYGLGKIYKGTKQNNLKAKQHLEQALNLVHSIPMNTLKEEGILKSLLLVYINLGDTLNAQIVAEEALNIVEKKEGSTSESYTNSLNEFGVVFWRAGFLEKAAAYENRALQIFENLEDSNSSGYIYASYVLGLIERDNNNYLKAIDAFKKVQKTMISQNDNNTDSYAQLLGVIGLIYDRIGNYEKAIYYCNQALEVTEISKRTISLRLMDKGYCYQNMGQYNLANQFYNESIESMKISHGVDSEKYAKLLNNRGKLYFEENRFDEALEYFKNALEINEKPEGEEWHNDYSYMLNDYAKTLLELGDNEQAIRLMEKNLNYFINKGKPKNEEFYNRKYSLANAYNLTGDFKSALPLIKESTSNLGDILGTDHVDYGDFLKTLSNTYFGLGMKDEGISSLLESNSVFVNQINKIFQFSSEQEKAAFMKMITNTFNQMQSLSQSDTFKDSSLDIANLNNQLMLKGLLLNNSKDILTKLSKIENDSLTFKIELYKNDKKRLSKLLTQYRTTNEKEIDSLKSVVNQREAELVKYYSTNFEGGISLTRNWEDVRKQLKQDEVAIEFAHFGTYKNNKSTGETNYIAYLYTKDELQPAVIPLFREKELIALLDKGSPNSLYAVRGSKGKSMKSTKGLYNLIWLPIEAYLKNLSPKKKVYFALSGILNQIPMSALGTKDKPILSYQYDLYQMGSTHNLINEINKKDNGNILLIGGVNYDIKSNEAESRASKWNELPGTLKEVMSIENILSKKG